MHYHFNVQHVGVCHKKCVYLLNQLSGNNNAV